MRRASLLFAFSACALSTHVDAQQALAQAVTLPNGVVVARRCEKIDMEGVVITSIDKRALPLDGAEYLASLSGTIARRVGVAASDPPRTAVYGALLLQDGTFARTIPVEQSRQRAFDSRLDEALSIAPSATEMEKLPAFMPDSLHVLVTVGKNADGTPFIATHTRCAPAAYPDNPKPETPTWTVTSPRTITVRTMVSEAGRPDTANAEVDETGDDRYVLSAMAAVARMRFVPAEFDGIKVPAIVSIVIPFGVTESADASTSR